jgi:8-oxo-dGTP diphosphatase
MKTAVCLLLQHAGKYLAVSRRDIPDQWGFPGGKADPYETDAEAVLRESKEEVWLLACLTSFSPLYSGHCPGEVDYWVTTYAFVDPVPVTSLDQLKAEDKLSMDWLTEDELCNPATSPFAEYNIQVFKALRQRWPGGIVLPLKEGLNQ